MGGVASNDEGWPAFVFANGLRMLANEGFLPTVELLPCATAVVVVDIE